MLSFTTLMLTIIFLFKNIPPTYFPVLKPQSNKNLSVPYIFNINYHKDFVTFSQELNMFLNSKTVVTTITFLKLNPHLFLNRVSYLISFSISSWQGKNELERVKIALSYE